MRSGLIHGVVAAVALGMLMPWTGRWLADTGLRWVHVLVLAVSLSFCLTPVCGWVARRLGILDQPDLRKHHGNPTPLLGGCAVFIAFFSAVLVNGVYTAKLWAILGAASALFVTGIADDAREVSAGVKLGAQVVCAVAVMAFGIVLNVIPEELGLVSRVGNVLLTVIWIIGITNAFNFFDGMDGLAAGLGAIIAFYLGIVAFQTHQPFLGWISAAMMGACLGFLPHNFRIRKNADIFLGDAGSTVIGFVLACVAVYGEWAENDPMKALVSPLLIFWILIFDMVHITVDRVITGKVSTLRQWIEYVGRDHLHHRIAMVLGGKKRSVIFIYLLSICLGTGAVVLRNAGLLDALLLLIQACVMVVLVTILERRGRLMAEKSISAANMEKR